MAAATELATYLLEQGLVQALYADLWINELPAEPDDLAALFDYGGEPDSYVLGDVQPDMEAPRVQLFERAADRIDAETRIRAKAAALNAIANQLLHDVWYVRVSRLQPPYQLGRDSNERFEWICNFRVHKGQSPM